MPHELKIRKGATRRLSMRWESSAQRFVAITGVTSTAPVRITAVAHGMPDGWRFAVSGIKGGGLALNSKHTNPKASDYFKAKVIDADTIEISNVNGASWPAYVSGGHIQYSVPVDLTGCSVRAQARESASSPLPLLTMDATNGNAVVDVALAMTTITFDPAETSAITASKAVFDAEVVFPNGDILPYPQQAIRFIEEVTR